MIYQYIIEMEVAVLFLSLILCVYLKLIYSSTAYGKRSYPHLCYTVALASVIDILCAIFQPSAGGYPAWAKYVCGIVWQFAACAVFFMTMRYIASFGAESPLKKKLRYAERIIMGSFVYFQLVGFFIGQNYIIVPGTKELTVGSFFYLLTFGYSLIWLAWSILMQLVNRKAFTRGQFWGLLIYAVSSILVLYLQSRYMRAIRIHFIVMTFSIYVFFFLLETPAYSELERTLNRLQRAKAMAEEAREAAEAADRAKGEFLANMSHEIRTPLTTILGMDEIIMKKYDSGPIYEYARDIHSAGNTLLRIINDILDFSKIESGQLELSPKKYSLGRVLRDVENMIRIKAEQKKLKFSMKVDMSLPNDLYGDHTRVHQVMVNILNNAVKYTKKGSVKFSLTGERGTDSDLIVLHISVADTGIGIHEEDLPKLFQSFSRVDMKQNHNVEGTGLGLAITGSLINMMGGDVNVESTYGVGSTFHVILPQQVVGTMTLKDFESEDAHARKKARKTLVIAPEAKVLVVDDNEMNRVVLRSLMKDTKVQVDTAEGGEECLSKVAVTAYDVILMDYMMPYMDGKQTMDHIRSMHNCPSANAKIVVCTANAIVGVQAELMAAGLDDFLSKPVNGKELEEILSRYIPKEKQREAAS